MSAYTKSQSHTPHTLCYMITLPLSSPTHQLPSACRLPLNLLPDTPYLLLCDSHTLLLYTQHVHTIVYLLLYIYSIPLRLAFPTRSMLIVIIWFTFPPKHTPYIFRFMNTLFLPFRQTPYHQ